ncbi:MAG TPA: PEP-CTERM sorting domain-containing protein [Verrucomicrobiae bacterium]|nr:PEP-CTERM sorting domain-containing protein [Verrucomicrobiae bacterium]
MHTRDASLSVIALAIAFAIAPLSTSATIINTIDVSIDGNPTSTNVFAGGTEAIGGYLDGDNLFVRRPYDGYDGSGSGTFRTLFELRDNASATNNPESGYNRATDSFPDVAMPGGLVGASIVYSNLKTDSSGQYFIFALDANENQAGSPNYYISLDDLRFYRGGTNDPSPLPGRSNLTDLGTLVWQMNTDGNNTNFIFVDAAINAGSGQSDLFVFIKKSLFDGAAANDYIYLYASMGEYSYMVPGSTDMTFNDGFEEWAILDTGTFNLVPEPGSIAALLLTCGGLFWHARRRRQTCRPT